jgi:hypothetical protein
MAEWTGKEEIFQNISIFDNDKFDVSNLLRIPFYPDNPNTTSIHKISNIPKRYLNLLSKRIPNIRWDRFVEQNIDRNIRTRKIYYGAPDLETRNLFIGTENVKFYTGTHKGHKVSLKYKPSVDDEMAIEGYGKINLGAFFINHIMLTIKFLEELTTEQTRENGEIIFEHDFETEYMDLNDTPYKAGTKKIFLPYLSGRNEFDGMIEDREQIVTGLLAEEDDD